ncbi:MAG: hypothetical protein IPL61_32080 [Myxococcales bacterium]|nr:hypothetical protein [Myxococcales bacterium]
MRRAGALVGAARGSSAVRGVHLPVRMKRTPPARRTAAASLLRRALPGLASLLLLGAAGACGIVHPDATDGGPPPIDAPQEIDAGVDAAPDATPQPPPTASRALVTGAGRMTSATYTFEVELGHPVDQRPARGATVTLEGNTAIEP